MFYETHITVEPHDVSRWQTLSGKLKIKPLLIELSSGDYPLHMMCSAPFRGPKLALSTHLAALEEEICRSGFSVLRVKPEIALGSGRHVRGLVAYYECHMKLLISGNQLAELFLFSREHRLPLSRNLLYREHNGLQKWYLTARLYNGSAIVAKKKFDRALADVKATFPVQKMDTECALYDTNPALDRGWIET